MKGFKQLGLLLSAGLLGVFIGVLIMTQMPNVSAAGDNFGHEHKLYYHESTPATCETVGTCAYWECEVCDKYYIDAQGLHNITTEEFANWIIIPKLKHESNEKYYTPAQASTCTQAGNHAYYTCINGCGGFFNEINCLNQLTKEQVTKSTLKHRFGVFVAAQEATCAQPGNIEHYECPACHGTFKDQNCTKAYHDVTVYVDHQTDDEHFTAEQPATCLSAGNLEHYTCVNCHQHFADIECTQEIQDVIIPKKAHQTYVTYKHDYVAPTCETAGHHTYWECYNGCGQKFKDMYCDEVFAVDAIIIPATGHEWVYEKANPNIEIRYQQDEHGNYQHSSVRYNIVCDHDGCFAHNGYKDVSGFGKIDTTRNTSAVESSIINDNGFVYDLYVLDWANSKIKTDDQGQQYAKIIIRLAGNYNLTNQSNLVENAITKNVNEYVYNNRVELIITTEIAANGYYMWQFDWDGDGITEQTIKLQVINFNA